jgi:hydroxymethylglutaryl-CoA synthase
MGGTYSSSTFIGLLGLIEGTTDMKPGELVSMFSYGSGCCAEFYCGRVGKNAKAAVAETNVASKLDARRALNIAEYERLESQRAAWADCGDYDIALDDLDGWYDRAYSGRHLLTFRGMKEFYRQYEWS